MKLLAPFLGKLQVIRYDEAGQALIEEVAALGEAIIPEIVDALRHETYNWQLPRVLAKIGKASVPALLELFFDPYLSQPIFESVVNTMIEVKDETFIGNLLPLIYGNDDKRADAALTILEHINNEQVTNTLAAILADKSSNLKLQTRALKLIGFCPSASHTIPLIRAFRKDKQLKYLAIVNLYRLGDAIELKTIEDFLLDKRPVSIEERAQLFRAIIEKQDKRIALHLLEKAITITKKARIGKRYTALLDTFIYLAGEFRLEEAVNVLAICLEYDELYWEATQALIKIGSDAALEILLDNIRLWWDRNIGWEKMGDNDYECQLLTDSFGARLFEPVVKLYENQKDYREIATEILSHLEDTRVTDFFLNISANPQERKFAGRWHYNLRLSKDKRLVELADELLGKNKFVYQSRLDSKDSNQFSTESGDEQELEKIYEKWQNAEDEKSKETYFNQLAKLKDERVIPELERLLYIYTEAKNPKAALTSAWKLSEYPQEKTGKILAAWFKAIPPNDNSREWFMWTADFPFLHDFTVGQADKKRLYWLIDGLYSPNLRVVEAAIEWLPIALDKQRFIPLLLPLLHDKRRIPNYNKRICDAAADRLKDYDIPLAHEIHKDWKKRNDPLRLSIFEKIKRRLSMRIAFFAEMLRR